MSYNISNWTTKSIENLTIPLLDIISMPDVNIQTDAGYVKVFGSSEGFEILGKITEGNLAVESIENYGEFSGNFQDELINLLRKSRGKMKAILVWEAGDSVDVLTVEDGNVETKELNL